MQRYGESKTEERSKNCSGKTGSHRLLETAIPKWIFRGGRQIFRPIKRFPVQGDALHLG